MDVKKAFAFRALCDVMVIGAQWNINMSWAWNTKRVWQKHQAIYYFRFLLWHHLDLTHLFWDERLFFWPNVIPKIFISYRNMIFDNSKIFFFLNVNGSIHFDFRKFGLSVIGSLKIKTTRLYWFSCFLKGPTSFNTFNIQMSVDMPFNNQITVILRPKWVFNILLYHMFAIIHCIPNADRLIPLNLTHVPTLRIALIAFQYSIPMHIRPLW